MDDAPAVPRWPIDRRRVMFGAGLALAAALLLHGLLPRLVGIDETWRRLQGGESVWVAAAVVFELLSFAGYVLLVRAVLGDGWFGWRVSLLVTLAGVAATRILATGGAGGIALTGWVLRRAGRSRREVGVALTAFLVILYAVFMAALIVGGLGLWTGLLPGPAPAALTLIPAGVAAVVVLAALGLSLTHGVLGEGVRHAVALVRGRDIRLAGAIAWWALDIATLWACLHAFGDPPAAAPLVVAYFVGMLGNLLPLPGGVGGVDGAMIGALIGFGTAAGLAIVGVLAYRLLAFWLPTMAGVPAYAALLRSMHAASHGRGSGLLTDGGSGPTRCNRAGATPGALR